MIYYVGNNLIDYPGIKTCDMAFCIDYLSKQPVIGLDIETGRRFKKGLYDESVYKPGLDPYLSRIVMIQVGTLEHQFVIDARSVNYEGLKRILEDESIVKVGHNLKFEGKFFLVHLKCRLVNVWDVMICENVLRNGLRVSYSLKSLMVKYLGYSEHVNKDLFSEDVEEEDDQFEDMLDMMDRPEKVYVDKSIRLQFVEIGDSPFTIDQIRYGVDDITAPLRLREIQLGEPYPIAFKLQNKFTQVLASMETEGIGMNAKAWLDLYEKNKEVYRSRIDMLNEYVMCNYPKFTTPPDLFGGKSCSISWTSSKQVVTFFRHLDICPREVSKQTKRLEWTVGAKAMFKLLTAEYKDYFYGDKWQEFRTEQDLILNYLLMKKSSMLCTTFGKDWLRHVHPITKKVHSSYRQYMISGRLSSNNPNLQNIPKGEEFRKCFVSEEGYIYINCDYSSQESKILADRSNVKVLVDFFVKGDETFGDDFHSYVATYMERAITKDPTVIVTKKTNKKKREIAKSMNFALAYGASAHSLMYSISSSLEETIEFIKTYFEALPGLEDYFNLQKKNAMKRGWIELDPYTKARYYFPDYDRMKQCLKEALSYYPEEYHQSRDREYRKAIGEEVKREFPIVRTLWKEYAILKGKLERRALNLSIQGLASAMTKMALILIYNNLKEGRAIVNTVHDEIIGKRREEDTEFSKIFGDCMIKAGTYFCKTVPMAAEVEDATYWKH